MGHLGYQNILRLEKVVNAIEVKGSISGETCSDCMKDRQQKKPSYEQMSQPNKYLKYLQCDLGDSYPITQTGNRFYFRIQDDATGACYAKLMRTKGQAFDKFQKFIR